MHTNQSEKRESQPTCEARLPRSPGLACGAARPCSSHNASHCVTCLPFSVKSTEGLPRLHAIQWKAKGWDAQRKTHL